MYDEDSDDEDSDDEDGDDEDGSGICSIFPRSFHSAERSALSKSDIILKITYSSHMYRFLMC